MMDKDYGFIFNILDYGICEHRGGRMLLQEEAVLKMYIFVPLEGH